MYTLRRSDNTAMNTQNHVDWINNQFPSNEYTVHIYFVTDMVNIRFFCIQSQEHRDGL